jgi:hypothetical protein
VLRRDKICLVYFDNFIAGILTYYVVIQLQRREVNWRNLHKFILQ